MQAIFKTVYRDLRRTVGLWLAVSVLVVLFLAGSFFSGLGSNFLQHYAQIRNPGVGTPGKSIEPGSIPKVKPDLYRKCMEQKDGDIRQTAAKVIELRKKLEECRTNFIPNWWSAETALEHCRLLQADVAAAESRAASARESKCLKR